MGAGAFPILSTYFEYAACAQDRTFAKSSSVAFLIWKSSLFKA